ncbi:hypothetical protein G6F70_004260 [Rhizopus microsporus]|nr:hypothetical protein G6F71_003534 [Rhizopus microsporus]KAG1200179.1 hypothetical protein G6F70_004260 [Rhizopus microsporus]KAG1212672.1 hypothetical protein G6F69_003484 [Rhizopus microsporus]KAG1229987.1 hypothetical protein G6F67_006774 [Rhizopus microsporus]KAG1261963.1 hypothetical protein G6F68_006289 [Rhizopus microsporus]
MSITEDDPNVYFMEMNVPEVRALEQKMRTEIETRKKELRSMVGEQYLELMSAADAIITMRQHTQTIQTNICRLQAACNVDEIKSNISTKKTRVDNERQHIYLIASLIKCLADVPEQIWHALENHRYLHASRLFTLAKVVHEYLEEEKKTESDIETKFPIIQSQWDAVSAFEPQILQRSLQHLQSSEQTSEHLAETLIGLMLLNESSYKDILEHLLKMRMNAIHDLLQHRPKKSDNLSNLIARQLKNIVVIFKQTLIQVDSIFLSKHETNMTLIESYVSYLKKTFLIPSASSHGNGTPSQPPVTRLLSPSSNVHLIVRYLPEAIQNYRPDFDAGNPLVASDIQQLTTEWINNVELLLKECLPEVLMALSTEKALTDTQLRLWISLQDDENAKNQVQDWEIVSHDLLLNNYSIWKSSLRDIFIDRAKAIIDKQLSILSDQPELDVWHTIVPDNSKENAANAIPVSIGIWPGVQNKPSQLFSLPSISSQKELQEFRLSLTETVNDRTDVLRKLQHLFDTLLSDLRKDVLTQVELRENDGFYCQEDSNSLKSYFQNKCYESVIAYSSGLKALLKRIDQWSDKKAAIVIGRLARNIALSSKELPKALALSAETLPIFVLRNDVNEKYAKAQDELLDTFHIAHEPWLSLVESKFTKNLEEILQGTKWKDECVSLWENVEEDTKLPTQATGAITRLMFSICEDIQRINSSMLDQTIMKKLRQTLYKKASAMFEAILSSKDFEITEQGSLQMIFDFLFIKSILQQDEDKNSLSKSDKTLDMLQDKVDPINWESYKPHIESCVDGFCIKQSLLFGVLTNAGSATYERARKIVTEKQKVQSNILIMPKGKAFIKSLLN